MSMSVSVSCNVLCCNANVNITYWNVLDCMYLFMFASWPQNQHCPSPSEAGQPWTATAGAWAPYLHQAIISYDFRHSSPSPPIVEIVQTKKKEEKLNWEDRTRKTLRGKLEDLDL